MATAEAPFASWFLGRVLLTVRGPSERTPLRTDAGSVVRIGILGAGTQGQTPSWRSTVWVRGRSPRLVLPLVLPQHGSRRPRSSSRRGSSPTSRSALWPVRSIARPHPLCVTSPPLNAPRHPTPPRPQSPHAWNAAARDKARATEFARKHGIPVVYGSYDELFASPDIDAVYIPSPNGLHKEHALAALRAGTPPPL